MNEQLDEATDWDECACGVCGGEQPTNAEAVCEDSSGRGGAGDAPPSSSCCPVPTVFIPPGVGGAPPTAEAAVVELEGDSTADWFAVQPGWFQSTFDTLLLVVFVVVVWRIAHRVLDTDARE